MEPVEETSAEAPTVCPVQLATWSEEKSNQLVMHNPTNRDYVVHLSNGTVADLNM